MTCSAAGRQWTLVVGRSRAGRGPPCYCHRRQWFGVLPWPFFALQARQCHPWFSACGTFLYGLKAQGWGAGGGALIRAAARNGWGPTRSGTAVPGRHRLVAPPNTRAELLADGCSGCTGSLAGTDQISWTARRSARAASLWIAGWRGARPHWCASQRDDRDCGQAGARVPHRCKCRIGWAPRWHATGAPARAAPALLYSTVCTVQARTAQVGLGSVGSSCWWGTPGCTWPGVPRQSRLHPRLASAWRCGRPPVTRRDGVRQAPLHACPRSRGGSPSWRTFLPLQTPDVCTVSYVLYGPQLREMGRLPAARRQRFRSSLSWMGRVELRPTHSLVLFFFAASLWGIRI